MNDLICTLGTFDIPVAQSQSPFRVDLLKSNIILFGTPQSGKTNLIKLIINILHKKLSVDDEQIFILDFGGALKSYGEFPLVSAYFDSYNEEYVKRVFKILENKMKTNTDKLEGLGFSAYSTDDPKKPKIAHTTFFIDNINAFLEESRYTAYHEKFARLCRDGLSKGISIVATASGMKNVSSYLSCFRQKIALNFTESEYMNIFDRSVSSIGNFAGRGFANITEQIEKNTGTFDMNAPYEVHCSFAENINNEDDVEFKENMHLKFSYVYSEKLKKYVYEKCVKKYLVFPKVLTEEAYYELLKLSAGENTEVKQITRTQAIKAESEEKYIVPIGLDYIEFQPVNVNFYESRVLAIYSKRNFGSEELAYRIITNLKELNPSRKFVFFDDGRNKLENIYRSIFKKEYKELEDAEDIANANYAKYIKLKEEYGKDNSETLYAADAVLDSDHTLTELRKLYRNKIGIYINQYKNEHFNINNEAQQKKLAVGHYNTVKENRSPVKTSPMNQMKKYINEYCVDLGNDVSELYTGRAYEFTSRDPALKQFVNSADKDSTVFVIQSKLIYSSVTENQKFLLEIMPLLLDIAEERDYIFIFTDVGKITDKGVNDAFNSYIKNILLLDNIAEFAKERGQKTIFGEMDDKALKADYASCELGDGFFYDVEADKLQKIKFIQ